MAIKQLTVFVENKQGTVVSITDTLAKHNVNIRALSIAETQDFGILRLLVDDAAKAETVLLEHGLLVQSTEVVVVAVRDELGGLASLLEPMAEAGVNIEYMYSLIGRSSSDAYMVFRVTDTPAFLAMLEEKGLNHGTPAELGLK